MRRVGAIVDEDHVGDASSMAVFRTRCALNVHRSSFSKLSIAKGFVCAICETGARPRAAGDRTRAGTRADRSRRGWKTRSKNVNARRENSL